MFKWTRFMMGWTSWGTSYKTVLYQVCQNCNTFSIYDLWRCVCSKHKHIDAYWPVFIYTCISCIGGGRFVPKTYAKGEVGPKNKWEMAGWDFCHHLKTEGYIYRFIVWINLFIFYNKISYQIQWCCNLENATVLYDTFNYTKLS